MKKVIYAQAFPRSKVMTYLMHHAPNVIEHLVKIWVNPDHESVSHWSNEVYAFMPRIPKMVKIGVPDKYFILDNTYTGYVDLIPRFVKDAQKNYGYSQDVDINVLANWIKDYFIWYSDSLDPDGSISRQQIRDWINTTIN